jgi:hypothetical protein
MARPMDTAMARPMDTAMARPTDTAMVRPMVRLKNAYAWIKRVCPCDRRLGWCLHFFKISLYLTRYPSSCFACPITEQGIYNLLEHMREKNGEHVMIVNCE